MLEMIGLASLVVLTSAETFAFSGAVLWALAAFMHLGKAAEQGSFVFAGLLAVFAGYAVYKMARAQQRLET